MSAETQLIAVEQVRIGMFIKLDLSWFEHSFPMNSFKVTSEAQLAQLRALKLKHVRFIPAKSDMAAVKAALQGGAPSPVAGGVDTVAVAGMVCANIVEAKKARLEKLQQQREAIRLAEEKFVHAATVVRNINKTIFSQPEETLKEAGKLIDGIAEVFLSENDTVMHLIQQAGASEEIYFHSLNVSVLAMMLAHQLKCTAEQIKLVGMAGLFHDLGKVNVPAAILNKTEPLTRAERNFFELHTQYGAEIGKKAGMSNVILEVMAQHHEMLDGSGYPNQLQGTAIRLPTRIISVANVYDNLCNHPDPRHSLTPHEALSQMYAKQRTQLDGTIMATLIKNLGVYPPGTLVKLSNEAVGLVMNVNIGQALRPRVLVYDADVPKEDAIILDLSEEGNEVSISGSIRPGLLPRAIYDYLNPRKRVSYFYDNQRPSAPAGAAPAR